MMENVLVMKMEIKECVLIWDMLNNVVPWVLSNKLPDVLLESGKGELGNTHRLTSDSTEDIPKSGMSVNQSL